MISVSGAGVCRGSRRPAFSAFGISAIEESELKWCVPSIPAPSVAIDSRCREGGGATALKDRASAYELLSESTITMKIRYYNQLHIQ